MKITGAEIESGIRDWIKDEIKNSPNKEYDLGKFFFSVSSGTLGFLFAAEKLKNAPNWNWLLLLSFCVLLIATAFALIMVLPKNWKIKENTDLFDYRHTIIRRIVTETYIWFVLWLAGLCLGAWSVTQ